MLVWNLNEEDERNACLPGELSLPVLMLKPATVSSLGPDVGEMMKAVSKNLTLREVSTHGHWLQLEARDEVNVILKEFIHDCEGEGQFKS